jgi:hypothetical protein
MSYFEIYLYHLLCIYRMRTLLFIASKNLYFSPIFLKINCIEIKLHVYDYNPMNKYSR